MSLDKYRLPPTVTEGVTIALDDAPEVQFIVRLPTTYNKPYRKAMLMNLRVDAQGKLDMPLYEADEVRHSGFFSTCLVSGHNGDEEIEDLDDFFETYPLAAQELFKKAEAMAKEEEGDDAEVLGKPKLVSNG